MYLFLPKILLLVYLFLLQNISILPMNTYISLLRWINVAGQKKILMKDLRKLYEDLGMTGVVSYIQSGNVIFTSPKRDKLEIANIIKLQIQKDYWFDVEVLIITPKCLENILSNNPFEEEKMYIIYLFEEPSNTKKNFIKEKIKPWEAVHVIWSAVYFFCPDGYYGTRISTNFFEKIYWVKTTMRNLRTSKKLLELSQ